MEYTPNISAQICRRAFILPLLSAIMAVGLPSSQSYAETGIIYPDSANVSFSREVSQDTTTVFLVNQGVNPVENLFISEFTGSPTILLECVKDGLPFDVPIIEREFDTVYANRYVTRWLIGTFGQAVTLKYYCPGYDSYELCWSAGQPFAIFGIMPQRHIGPPTDIGWQQ